MVYSIILSIALKHASVIFIISERMPKVTTVCYKAYWIEDFQQNQWIFKIIWLQSSSLGEKGMFGGFLPSSFQFLHLESINRISKYWLIDGFKSNMWVNEIFLNINVKNGQNFVSFNFSFFFFLLFLKLNFCPLSSAFIHSSFNPLLACSPLKLTFLWKDYFCRALLFVQLQQHVRK